MNKCIKSHNVLERKYYKNLNVVISTWESAFYIFSVVETNSNDSYKQLSSVIPAYRNHRSWLSHGLHHGNGIPVFITSLLRSFVPRADTEKNNILLKIYHCQVSMLQAWKQRWTLWLCLQRAYSSEGLMKDAHRELQCRQDFKRQCAVYKLQRK